jgi:hypothetical protein
VLAKSDEQGLRNTPPPTAQTSSNFLNTYLNAMALPVTADGILFLSFLVCVFVLWRYFAVQERTILYAKTSEPLENQDTSAPINRSISTQSRESLGQPPTPTPAKRLGSDMAVPTSVAEATGAMPAGELLPDAAVSTAAKGHGTNHSDPNADSTSAAEATAAVPAEELLPEVAVSAAAKGHDTNDSDPNAVPTPSPGPKCFRIANVPSAWSKDDLFNSLREIDPSLEQGCQLWLYPACYGSTQTALLNLRTCTEYFQRLNPNDFNYVSTSDETDLVIDSTFYDLTPLNSPGDEVVAELALPCLSLSSPC